MAKKQRHLPGERGGKLPEVAVHPQMDPSLLEQGSLGNQALQAQLSGTETYAEPGLDVVRDVALPKLERSILALQFLARPPEQVSRFVDILQRSNLEQARRQALIDKLLTDQGAAEAVADSTERWLGGDDESWRSQVLELLELTYAGLESGEAHGETWQLETGETVALDALGDGASTAERAGALVGEVAEALASDELRERLGKVSTAIQGYVSAVVLAVLLEEEEEEEEGVWGEVVEEG